MYFFIKLLLCTMTLSVLTWPLWHVYNSMLSIWDLLYNSIQHKFGQFCLNLSKGSTEQLVVTLQYIFCLEFPHIFYSHSIVHIQCKLTWDLRPLWLAPSQYKCSILNFPNNLSLIYYCMPSLSLDFYKYILWLDYHWT